MLPGVAGSHEQQPSAPLPEPSPELENEFLRIFKLLSDKTRLRILLYLDREKELHVKALCQKLGQSQPAVSHHLALLREAGLIESRRAGKHNFYSLCRSYFARIKSEFLADLSEPEKAELAKIYFGL